MKIFSPLGREYEVKPCPFCGNAPEMDISGFSPARYVIACHKCSLRSMRVETHNISRPGRAVAIWNRKMIPN